jgi:hypothetical protein
MFSRQDERQGPGHLVRRAAGDDGALGSDGRLRPDDCPESGLVAIPPGRDATPNMIWIRRRARRRPRTTVPAIAKPAWSDPPIAGSGQIFRASGPCAPDRGRRTRSPNRHYSLPPRSTLGGRCGVLRDEIGSYVVEASSDAALVAPTASTIISATRAGDSFGKKKKLPEIVTT